MFGVGEESSSPLFRSPLRSVDEDLARLTFTLFFHRQHCRLPIGELNHAFCSPYIFCTRSQRVAALVSQIQITVRRASLSVLSSFVALFGFSCGKLLFILNRTSWLKKLRFSDKEISCASLPVLTQSWGDFHDYWQNDAMVDVHIQIITQVWQKKIGLGLEGKCFEQAKEKPLMD